MSSRIFALDIRESGLSAVLVKTGIKENRLENRIYVDFAKAPDPEHKLDWAVERAVAGIDPAGAYCLVSIPPSVVSFRNISVPFKNRKKIRQILPFELEPTLPLEIEKVKLDFMVVRQAEQTDLIVAAAERQKLEDTLDLLGRHGISPRYVTTGGVPAAMCLAESSAFGLKDFLFIDNDRSGATACLVVEGRVSLVRTLRKTPQSGDAASSAKELSAEIRRMLSAFESIYDTELNLEKLVISGFGAEDQYFVSALETALGINADCLNLKNDTDLNISVAEDMQAGPEIYGAFCLVGVEVPGLKPFNFGRRHSAFEKYWNENRPLIITSVALVFFVLLLFITQVAMEAHFLERRVSAVERRIVEQYRSAFPDDGRIVAPVQQMKAKLGQAKGKDGFVKQAGSDILNVDILKNISRLIPERTDVVITRFVRDSGGVQLSGLTGSFNAVDDIKMQLEKSPHLNQIAISSANMDRNAERIRFRIKAGLAGEGQ
ncbi:MAG: PilN domain-containing protein [Desulfobacteraceae bacterium]|nr:PilN domain-containing protein [Desulfobacteraceae bacterium]